MARFVDQVAQVPLGTLEHEGRKIDVFVRVAYDGIEYVGRLWFADHADLQHGIPDRASLPGRTKEDAIGVARGLTQQELSRRYRRALAEKRRYHALRRATDEVLSKIRYLNQVAISMRAGLLDFEGAAQELELTERQLHECIDRLRDFAGVESDPETGTSGEHQPK